MAINKNNMNYQDKDCYTTKTMMTDLYQLTMMQGHFVNNTHTRQSVFDVYFRAGEVSRYCVFAGLQQVIDFVQSIQFCKKDIEYLRELKIFDESFLKALLHFRFEGDIDSVVEGEVVFADQPLMRVSAPLWQAQLVETAILNIVGFESLVASRASRMVQAARGKEIVEFGLRRAHGASAGLYASRAAFIGGVGSTSNVMAGQLYGIPVKGTMSHAWIQSFETELQAFSSYAKTYPTQCMLLLDTYNTLDSGLPNAIKVFDDLKAQGHRPIGVRIDSGDFAYLSKAIRAELDRAEYKDAIIFVSGDVDENIIETLNLQGASIDAWGIGGKLVTGHPKPIFGMVYKMASLELDGKQKPTLKISDTSQKTSNPGIKQLYRIYDSEGMAFADLIMLQDETLTTPLTLTHPVDRYKTLTITDYTTRNLHTKIYQKGTLVYKAPPLAQSSQHLQDELQKFWSEYKRNTKPHIYKVNLSDGLYNLKHELVLKNRNKG